MKCSLVYMTVLVGKWLKNPALSYIFEITKISWSFSLVLFVIFSISLTAFHLHWVKYVCKYNNAHHGFRLCHKQWRHWMGAGLHNACFSHGNLQHLHYSLQYFDICPSLLHWVSFMQDLPELKTHYHSCIWQLCQWQLFLSK